MTNQPDTPIVFENPPKEKHGHPADHRSVATALTARPGEWARIGTYATRVTAGTMAYQIRHGRTGTWQPAGAFEAVSRTVDGEYRVYARYIGTTPEGGAQ